MGDVDMIHVMVGYVVNQVCKHSNRASIGNPNLSQGNPALPSMGQNPGTLLFTSN